MCRPLSKLDQMSQDLPMPSIKQTAASTKGCQIQNPQLEIVTVGDWRHLHDVSKEVDQLSALW